jgi:hypothetical protein
VAQPCLLQRLQHTRQQAQGVPGRPVLTQRDLVGRAAADVGPGAIVQPGAGQGIEVGQADGRHGIA